MSLSSVLAGAAAAAALLTCAGARAAPITTETKAGPIQVPPGTVVPRSIPKVEPAKDPDHIYLQIFGAPPEGSTSAPSKWTGDAAKFPNFYLHKDMTVKLRYFVGTDVNAPAGTTSVRLEASDKPNFAKLVGSKTVLVSKDGTLSFKPYTPPFMLGGAAYVYNSNYLRIKSGATVSNTVTYISDITIQ